MKKILILGVGTLAVYTAELAEEAGYEVLGHLYLSSDFELDGYKICGRPVYTLADKLDDSNLVVAVEDQYDRRTAVRTAGELGFGFETIVHPTSDISLATIREGCVIGRNVVLGEKVMIDPYCVILDNTEIEERSHIRSYLTAGGACQNEF